jgi:type II secretory pathway pseudopilin PulG
MVLVAVIVLGILMEVATIHTSRAQQAEREAELLYRGMAYRNAIKSYYETGKPVKVYPKSLEDLVKDPRSAHKRHLRALYPDPMSKGKGEWLLIRAVDGGIAGVASMSKEAPIKTVNFPAGLEKLEGKKLYSEWVFEYALVSPAATSEPLVAPPPPYLPPPLAK